MHNIMCLIFVLDIYCITAAHCVTKPQNAIVVNPCALKNTEELRVLIKLIEKVN